MGNSGLRKIFFPGDIVENKYNSFYELNAIDLDKNEVPLSNFKNKVCLVVNIASQHRDTPTELQTLKQLQEKYEAEGLQFSNEPEAYKPLKERYFKSYGVPFPVFAKVEVNGEYSAPVFKYLKKNSPLYNFKLLNANPIREDFCKFIVDREGNVVKYLERLDKAEILTQEIENQLRAPIKKEDTKTHPAGAAK